jgi:DNA-binding PadR family transcriptional regulator
MATVAIGDTSIGALCIGLLTQQEDTIQGLDRRLKRHFASANFARGAASKSIARLEAVGHVEIAEEGDKRTLHRYRATPAGEAYFLEWLHQIELPPAIRDAMQCKLEFFPIEDLQRLIDAVVEQQEAFTHGADLAHDQLGREQRAQSSKRRRGQPPDWRRELQMIKTKDAAKLGNLMADRLEELREHLEELRDASGEMGAAGG